ncbi:hypothetical protein RB598_002665 [Gaeumannomyces tritici]
MAGAGSTTSSLTSTSHTLTHAPMASASSDMPPPPEGLAALLSSMQVANRHQFMRPPRTTPTASLYLAKDTLDAFAGQVSDEQQARLRDANRKRKRGGGDLDRADVLKVRKLHVDGFETSQVWQQAKRIINSTLSESLAALEELQEDGEVLDGEQNGNAKMLEFGKDGFEVGSDGDSEDDSDASRSSPSDAESRDEEDVSAELSDEEGADVSDDDEDALEGDEEQEEGERDGEEEGSDADSDAGQYIEDPNGLNDGFFNIDEFNKQTQWFEDQDAKADPNTDVVSEDEDLDWHTDPMAPSKTKSKSTPSSSKRAGKEEITSDLENDEEDDDDEEGGPTFGDMDLDAPEGASDDEFGGDIEGDLEGRMDLTADDIFFKDFFARPPRKAQKGDNKRNRDYRPKQPKEYDVEAAMEGVKRDLFDDMSEGSGSEGALSDVEAGDPKARRSAHERRQAKITEEIRKLEAAMVKPKEWTLSGEAAAPDRPVNSLLEEDLEFEHAGKPVPVITEDVSESIEQMIKRRIIAQEFDEVIRRVPGSELPVNTRRGLVEVDDTKAKQGLAEMYEEEYVKNANPDSYVSQSDEKLRREEKEVEQMWRDISAQLDALSSWHYKPRPAGPSLTVVADVATVAMEDAQPTTAQGVSGGASTLAPQEVYRAGKATAGEGEVVPKSGLPVARQELSREDKVRRRRREKERIRKAGGGADAARGKAPPGKKAQERKETMADLRKGGVMVINRQGEIMDVDGNKPKAASTMSSGALKL